MPIPSNANSIYRSFKYAASTEKKTVDLLTAQCIEIPGNVLSPAYWTTELHLSPSFSVHFHTHTLISFPATQDCVRKGLLGDVVLEALLHQRTELPGATQEKKECCSPTQCISM